MVSCQTSHINASFLLLFDIKIEYNTPSLFEMATTLEELEIQALVCRVHRQPSKAGGLRIT